MKIEEIPIWPKRQDNVESQLSDLCIVANRIGLYDAADVLRQWSKKFHEVKYGCHCGIEAGIDQGECVIDSGDLDDCIHANIGMRKEQCEYWRVK